MLSLLRKTGRSGMKATTLALPLALFLVLCFLSSSFLSFQNLANVNSQIAGLLIVSLGQMIVAISGGIDLSVGSVMSLTSAMLVTLDPQVAVPAVLAVGVAVGLVNGLGVTWFNVHPLVMSLATMTFLQGMALLVHPVPGGAVPEYLTALTASQVGGVPAAFFWCVTALVVTAAMLNLTRFGLRIFAIGANPTSAARNGVSVTLHRIVCYVACSVSAVLAGIFLTSRVAGGDATIGASYALDSVTAIALGGVQLAGGAGSVAGVVAGVLTLGFMTNGMNLVGISPFLRTAATGCLLLLAIGLQRRKVIGA
jgi:ribose transport system permease protein